jgi:hypothetical protein
VAGLLRAKNDSHGVGLGCWVWMDAHGSGNYVDSGETPTKVEIELHRRNPHRSGEVFARSR